MADQLIDHKPLIQKTFAEGAFLLVICHFYYGW